MAVRHNKERTESVHERWEALRAEMVAEYRLVSDYADMRENLIPLGPDPRTGNDLGFEMINGVPAVVERRRIDDKVRLMVGIVGSAEDFVGEHGENLSPYKAHLIKGQRATDLLAICVDRKDEVLHKFGENMKAVRERHIPRESLEDLIYQDVLLDDRSLDRGTFYGVTAHWSRRELFDMQERIRERATGVMMDPVNHPFDPDGVKAREKVAKAERHLEVVFSDWNRLAGRMEWRCMSLAEAHGGMMTAKDVVTTADWAMKEPSYAAYREKTVPAWVKYQFGRMGLNYEKVPERLRPQMERPQVKQIKR